VHIPIASLQLGDADWNRRILDRTFFDVKKYPEATFVSTQVHADGDGEGTVTGALTMHGVTRPVTLSVTLNALKRHPLTLHRTAGFSASGVISRKDFGMDAWSSMVGDQVKLQIECEALRTGEADAAAR
jgi:polyisoprenoid-binding protein YceI